MNWPIRNNSIDSIAIFTIIKNHVGSPKADLIWREIKEYLNA